MVTPVEPSGRQDGTIGPHNSQSGLADRGIGFQAVGFVLVWLVSTAILELFQGSGYWLYQWFERATVDIYWSALVPLGAFFDWVRKMFERGKAIREAKKAEIEEKAVRRGLERGMKQGIEQGIERGIEQGIEQGIERGIEQGRQQATEQFRELLKQHGIALTPEVESAMFGDSANGDS